MVLRMVPGPTSMSAAVRQAYAEEVGSPDVETEEFFSDYFVLEATFQRLLNFSGSIVIGSGEGMVCLWGALNSVLSPGDTVLCVVNGIFGEGFAGMAKDMKANVICVHSDWTQGIDPNTVIAAIKEHNPRLVTLVHCETPSGVKSIEALLMLELGIVNPLDGIGKAIREYTTDGLFLVDFVSSSFGVVLNVDEELIDLGLFAPQKVLSGPCALACTTVTERAWERIRELKYQGYDALLPFDGLSPSSPLLLPYTHNWPAIRATMAAANAIETEGKEAVIARHAAVAQFCREEAVRLGLELYCQIIEHASPTVTALKVPTDKLSWEVMEKELKAEGLICGGSYGSLYGNVFRIGHMGTQANGSLVKEALDIIARVIASHT
ncbi:serine-pyruvate aminotransferase [Thraustotheca clavata]|uniref:alanine--glyoxylate transaminase n=1 Tax=Thraustotheca clavata TaxID=74557 RepID=A0A1V9ZSA4_9STRA|nr:serine-pyruvate aminotransferase [Thraustotheca clavata]